jgi:putative OPT family oligopeptide transporter
MNIPFLHAKPGAGQGPETPELTLRAFVLGIILSVLMTAANTYLGLYAGMTVSASIPAAVISMAVMRGIMRRGTVLENNIVQTMASAGESLAAGIIFTVPALVIVGVWKDFQFWPTTLIALCGGVLGVIFMIPLRRALIVEDRELSYPEGVACAEVLRAGQGGGSGFSGILQGLAIGGGVKLLTTGIRTLMGTVEGAFTAGGRIFFMGCDISPAMLAVGYIVNIEIATLVFAGSALAWIFCIPLMGIPDGTDGSSPLDLCWYLWSNRVRYIGVGAMVVGGLWSIVSVRHGIRRGISGLRRSALTAGAPAERTDRDLGLGLMAMLFAANLVILAGLYEYLTRQMTLSIVTALCMSAASFFFVAVSSYIVGLVGSTNNPISGMTISALLGASALFLVLGWKGDSAMLATLGVAGVVCCAASSAGDMSQDLKTGQLVGATPARQQAAQIAGVAVAAFFIAPILSLLHGAYGIGTGLRAPQATLFASITGAVFGSGSIPRDMILIGAAVGVVIIILDELLKRSRLSFRLHVMPLAVGIYLPLTLIVPMLIGGIVRYAGDRRRGTAHDAGDQDTGLLLSSGMIAGEAIMGILLAGFIVMDATIDVPLPGPVRAFLSLGVMAAAIVFLARKARRV